MIVINQQPQQDQPIYNDFIIGVETDLNPLPPNFKYVADVYVNDTFVRRMKVFPNKSQDGVFRFDRILQDYVNWELIVKPEIGEPFRDISCSSTANVRFDFIEEYGSLSTGTTLYTGTSTPSQTFTYYNGAISYLGDVKNNYNPSNLGLPNRGNQQTFVNYSNRNFQALPESIYGFGGQFMTDSPRELWMDYWETYQLGILQKSDFNVAKLVLKTYDFNNTLIQTENYSNLNFLQPVLTGICNSSYYLNILVGPRDINSVHFSYGFSPIINPNVKYYEVYTEFDDGVSPVEKSSEVFRIYVKQKTYYDKFRLVWLNNYGTFERYTFEGRNLQTKSVKENKEIQNQLGIEVENGGLVYGVESTIGRENIYRTVENTYNVFSQFLKKDESYWLNQLYTSPQVFLEVCEQRNNIIRTENRGGFMEIYYQNDHYYQINDLLGIFNCTGGNNFYGSILEVMDSKSIYTDVPYSSITSGFSSRLLSQNKHLPIVVNDKSYAIRQGINPRNIQLQINFSLANEDPKQNGGYNKRADPYSI